MQQVHDLDTLVPFFISAFANCVDEETLTCIIDWLQIEIVSCWWLSLSSPNNTALESTTTSAAAAVVVIVGFIAHPKCIPIMILPLCAFARITNREWRKWGTHSRRERSAAADSRTVSDFKSGFSIGALVGVTPYDEEFGQECCESCLNKIQKSKLRSNLLFSLQAMQGACHMEPQ